MLKTFCTEVGVLQNINMDKVHNQNKNILGLFRCSELKGMLVTDTDWVTRGYELQITAVTDTE